MLGKKRERGWKMKIWDGMGFPTCRTNDRFCMITAGVWCRGALIMEMEGVGGLVDG
jgi:hypothetical protein